MYLIFFMLTYKWKWKWYSISSKLPLYSIYWFSWARNRYACDLLITALYNFSHFFNLLARLLLSMIFRCSCCCFHEHHASGWHIRIIGLCITEIVAFFEFAMQRSCCIKLIFSLLFSWSMDSKLLYMRFIDRCITELSHFFCSLC